MVWSQEGQTPPKLAEVAGRSFSFFIYFMTGRTYPEKSLILEIELSGYKQFSLATVYNK